MLNRYFVYPGVLTRMRQGPLRSEIDTIASDLERAGYTRLSARRYLTLIASFSRYAQQSGCVRARAIDRPLVERFLRRRAFSKSTAIVARSALGHVLRRLRCSGPTTSPSASESKDAAVLARFDHYLADIRGLESKSREELRRAAAHTLRWYRAVKSHQRLARFSAQDVLAYASHACTRCAADGTRSAAMSHLRTFLRYLRWAGIARDDLSPYVPRVPIWSLAKIPEALPWQDIRRLIDCIEPGDPSGPRDRAVLLLAATTGMRNAELRRLELGDIRWRDGEIHLRRTKSRRDRVVPLVPEAGRALAEYILRGRPQTEERRIFLSHRPPVRPVSHSSTISAIVKRRLARLHIHPTRAGTHLLRHSLATQLVRQERPIKEVADLLGHQHINTTAVYVKVAVSQLTTVAMPFPGGEA
jgi:site-specific recombinase XerD